MATDPNHMSYYFLGKHTITIDYASELLMRDVADARIVNAHDAELSALVTLGKLHGYFRPHVDEEMIKYAHGCWVYQEFIRGQFPHLQE